MPMDLRVPSSTRRARSRLYLLSIALVCLSGCANQKFTESGFLSDYDLNAVETTKDFRAAVDKDRLDNYQNIVVDTPIAWLGEQAPSDAQAIDELLLHFRDALTMQLGAGFTIVDEVGPQTLRIEAALTDVDGSNPALNAFTGIVAVPVDNGGATIEFRVADSTTGSVIATGNGFAEGGALQVIKSFSRYGHARYALTKLAERVAQTLCVKPGDVDTS